MGYFCLIMEKTYEDLMLGESAWLLELEAPVLYTKTEVMIAIQESVNTLPPEQNNELKVEEKIALEYAGVKSNSKGISFLFLAPPLEKENPPVRELIDKMAQALGLNIGEYEQAFTDDFFGAIMQHLPKVVVGLGVLVNQSLLLNKEKLANMRGHDYPLMMLDQNRQEHRFLLTPLFHPDFLLINPNMKKMAWEDLQRIQNVLR
jgi:hypothetical protein